MRYFKWICKVFFLCLILSTLAVSASAADFAGGSGTANSPYLISTKEQLNRVRNNLNAHYKLTADITFTSSDFSPSGKFYNGGAGWEPIGSGSVFKGTFDGNGYTISGLYQSIVLTKSMGYGAYGGLFGGIREATVKNLGLLNLDISITANSYGNVYIGGVTGSIGSGSTVKNCYSTGKITGNSSASGRVYAGGIAGISQTCDIRDCYNLSTVSAKAASTEYADAGGIVGDSSGTTISGCYNKGKITGGFAGGIVGYASATTISDCYNTESVAGNNNALMCRAGGIVGYASGGVSECYNTGSVTASSSSSAICGGIAGQMTSPLEACYNLGTVTAAGTGSGNSKAFAGGIAGLLYRNISRSYNTGAVTASGTSNSEVFLGGITGKAYSTNAVEVNVKNCYNTGSVKEGMASMARKSYVGGIAGHAESTGAYSRRTTISDCYHAGTVKAKTAGAYTGGVAGYKGGYTDILKCYYLDTSDVGIGSGTGTTTKCTTAQMETKNTFSGLDFTNTWTMRGNADYLYPELIGVSMIYTKTATSAKLTSLPVKLVYEQGEELDVTGGKLQVSYDNGTSKTVAITTEMVTGFDSSAVGSQTLTVSYDGISVRFTVDVVTELVPTISIDFVGETAARLTITHNKEGTCFLAVYDSEGRMISCGAGAVTDNVGEATVSLIPFEAVSGYTVKAFLVDLQNIPVCECVIT